MPDEAPRSTRASVPPAPSLSVVATRELVTARRAEASPASVPPPASADPPLVAIHEALERAEAVLVVTASDASARTAASAHVERLLRLRATAFGASDGEVRVARARRMDEGELVDAIAVALGAQLDTRRVGAVSDALAERLRRGHPSLVVRLDEPTTESSAWSTSVVRELVAALAPAERGIAPIARMVIVAPVGCASVASLGVPVIRLGEALEPREVAAWMETAARATVRALASSAPTLTALEAAHDTIVEAPVIGALAASRPDPHVEAPTVEGSPWTWLARAAEAIEAGDEARADASITRAETLADDPDARRDVGRRWAEVLEPRAAAERLEHARRATNRALANGEAEEAARWAKIAVRAGELAEVKDGVAAGLLEAQGRALVAKGDVVMARAVLARARERAIAGQLSADAIASIAVETAEAAYLGGDMASSESEARRATQIPGLGAEVRLRARNVLGKILLARASWDHADMHFASDASDAARVGDRRGELRAHLNRAIALLFAERLDEAEGLFEAVLEGGRALGEPRAEALALENLAVIASMRRDYGMALERFRAAISSLKRLGQAALLAGAAHNLGYLYLRLGDVVQATNMVRFAASLFRRGLAAPLVAEGDELRARIAARMGRSEEALAAISHAREILRSAGETTRVADCDRVEARLALDDGDVRGARFALDRARSVDASPRGRAEQALLEAEWTRANGATGAEVLVATREALALCRASTDEDLIVEAHLLVAEVARVTGDRELFQRHLEAAGGVRDAMLRSCPTSYHAMFLARPDMVRLGKLERLAESEPIPAIVPAMTSESAGARVRTTAVPTEPRRMVGNDPSLRALMSAVRRVATSDTAVLVHGESGTGKELVAEALHFASDRAQGPLVKVNCAALVETLLLSELFGHEKGAFTGAVARRRGRFELADGGTLFLDEIGDISPRTQVALLRVLQEKTFERVGGTTPIHVDVRIVTATHRDLAAMVARGEFREDLFYRLRGVQLEVPPLRARLGDLPDLCDHLLRRVGHEHNQPPKTLTREALDLLAAHKWPGNVRELENVLRAVALLTDGPEIRLSDLVEHVDVLRALEPLVAAKRAASLPFEEPRPSGTSVEAADEEAESGALPSTEASATAVAYGQIRAGGVSLSEMKRMIERDCIARALAETRGNITKAAALLGVKRPRLSQLVKHYGLSSMFTEGS